MSENRDSWAKRITKGIAFDNLGLENKQQRYNSESITEIASADVKPFSHGKLVELLFQLCTTCYTKLYSLAFVSVSSLGAGTSASLKISKSLTSVMR